MKPIMYSHRLKSVLQQSVRELGLTLASTDRLVSTPRRSSIALIATGSAFVVGMTLLGVFTMNLPQGETAVADTANVAASEDGKAEVEPDTLTLAAGSPLLVVPPSPQTFALADEGPATELIRDVPDPPPAVTTNAAKTEAELPWVTALRKGRPLPAAAVESQDCVTKLAASLADVMLNFRPASSDLNPEDFDTLLAVGQEVNACPEARVLVAGHSDSTGTDAVNLKLSWDRAEATVDALDQMGFDVLQFETVGFGARSPLAQGSSTAEAVNRRVELRVVRE